MEGKRKTTRYYLYVHKWECDTKKQFSACKRITKAKAEELLKKAGKSLADFRDKYYEPEQEICVKHVGKRKYEKYDQNWYVCQSYGTYVAEDHCDEGLEI